MDYKEGYENAIKRAKAILEVAYNREEAFGYVSTIFPELAESEDGRIRKSLIALVRQSSEVLSKQNQESMIAWLEKHTYTQRDVDDAYLKGVTDAKKVLGKQGKQTNFFQNVSLTEFEEALADVCRGWIGEEIGWKDYIIRNANALLKICQKMWNEVQDAPFEQKPTWSEEDEKILNNLIDYFKVDDALQYSEMQVVSWLKSLKDRLKGE